MGLVRIASKYNLVFPNERFQSRGGAVLLCAAKKLPHTLVSYDVCYVLLSSTYKEPKPRFILVENEVSMFGILLQNTEHTQVEQTSISWQKFVQSTQRKRLCEPWPRGH